MDRARLVVRHFGPHFENNLILYFHLNLKSLSRFSGISGNGVGFLFMHLSCHAVPLRSAAFIRKIICMQTNQINVELMSRGFHCHKINTNFPSSIRLFTPISWGESGRIYFIALVVSLKKWDIIPQPDFPWVIASYFSLTCLTAYLSARIAHLVTNPHQLSPSDLHLRSFVLSLPD